LFDIACKSFICCILLVFLSLPSISDLPASFQQDAFRLGSNQACEDSPDHQTPDQHLILQPQQTIELLGTLEAGRVGHFNL